MNAKPYESPGLCTFLRVLAVLRIGGGAVLAVLSFVLGAGALTAGAGHCDGAMAAGGIIFYGSVAIRVHGTELTHSRNQAEPAKKKR